MTLSFCHQPSHYFTNQVCKLQNESVLYNKIGINVAVSQNVTKQSNSCFRKLQIFSARQKIRFSGWIWKLHNIQFCINLVFKSFLLCKNKIYNNKVSIVTFSKDCNYYYISHTSQHKSYENMSSVMYLSMGNKNLTFQ